MKRVFALLLCMLILIIGVCGCEKEVQSTSSTASTHTDVSVKQLEKLFDENLYCMQRLVELGHLPYSNQAIDGGHLYPVESDRFPTYAALYDYLCTVYTEETVSQLLDNDGMPVYVEVDGRLCIDSYHIGGKGYFVDWSNYKITIDSTDETGVSFTITGSLVEPGDNPTPQPYSATGTAVFENGRLVLTKMIH